MTRPETSRQMVLPRLSVVNGSWSPKKLKLREWQVALCSGQRKDVINRNAEYEHGDH